MTINEELLFMGIVKTIEEHTITMLRMLIECLKETNGFCFKKLFNVATIFLYLFCKVLNGGC